MGTICEDLGLSSRRENPALYSKEWRARNRAHSNAYHRQYYSDVTREKPERMAAIAKSQGYSRRKAKYGITKTEYLERLQSQGGCCMICKREYGEALRVDHNHQTGAIRGLLCNNCNAGLGFFAEDVSSMKRAIEYIETSAS